MNLTCVFSFIVLSALPFQALGAVDSAYVLFRDGDYEGAASAIEARLSESPSPDLDERAELEFDLGSCALYLGHPSKAEHAFRRSILLFDRVDPSSAAAAIAREGLAVALIEVGNVLEAEDVLEESLEIRQALYGNDHPQTFRSLNLLASLLKSEQRNDEAVALYDRVITGFRRLYGNVHAMTAAAAQNLGTFLMDSSEEWPAEIMFQQALFIETRLHGEKHPALALPLCGLGEIKAANGNTVEAREAYTKALDLVGRSDTPDVPPSFTALIALTGIGRCHLADGDHEAAIPFLMRASAMHDHLRYRVGADTEQALFMASPRPILAHALLIDDKPLAAWRILEGGRGRLVMDLAARRSVGLDSLDRDLYLLETELAGRFDGNDLDLIARRNAYLDERSRRFAALEPDVNLTPSLDDTGLSPAPHGSVVIGWLDAELEGTKIARWAYVLTDGGDLQWRRLSDTTRSESQRIVTAVRSSIVKRTIFSSVPQAAASEVWYDRMAAIEDLIQNASVLCIVVSGEVSAIPFAAIGPEADKMLIDRHTIAIGSSATVFTRDATRDHPETAKALVVANPGYSGGSTISTMPGPVLRSILGHNTEALNSLPRLPGTQREADAVERAFPGATMLTGLQANEAQLRDLANANLLPSYSLIHFGTHALVDPFTPERSAVVLTPPDAIGSNEGPVSNDGLVSAREIRLGWSLAADVVVLSGCETGLGLATSDDGVLGLTNAFLQAGARSVVSSLWRVDDTATARLMEFYYDELSQHGLEGFGPHKALAAAQRRYRGSYIGLGNESVTDAWAWSGFVISGH